MRTRARSHGDAFRCTYCLTSVGRGEALLLCPRCGATFHGACLRELGHCSALGCGWRPSELDSNLKGPRTRGGILDLEFTWAILLFASLLAIMFGAADFLPLRLVLGSLALLGAPFAALRDHLRPSRDRRLPFAVRAGVLLVFGAFLGGIAGEGAGALLGNRSVWLVGAAVGAALALVALVRDCLRGETPAREEQV